MTLEFVTIDNGEEVDWIDPVVFYKDCGAYWRVDNGYHTYHVDKRPNREIVVREYIESS